jgi:hypothetical protein
MDDPAGGIETPHNVKMVIDVQEVREAVFPEGA